MKVIFMGTPEMSAAVLKKLLESKHETVLVVTQPDRESGRGRGTVESAVKICAKEAGIEVFQPESVSSDEALEKLKSYNADIFVVVAYAQKLPDRLLEMAPYGCINIHPSLLPKYRGAAPFRGAILNGDEYSGITIMKVVSKWDAGDILMQKKFPMDAKETPLTLEEKVKTSGSEMLIETIDGLENGTITPVPQDDSKSSYIKQVKKEDGLIDFSKSAVEIERQVRACIPWPSAYTYLEGKMFKIWDADAETDKNEESLKMAEFKVTDETDNLEVNIHKISPGTVVVSDKKNLAVMTGQGILKLNEVQLEGKKRMNTEDFLRGKKVEKGTELGK